MHKLSFLDITLNHPFSKMKIIKYRIL